MTTWNDKFELTDGSYSASDMQDYFEYIIKKHDAFTVNPPIRIYINKEEKRITFKIKTGYYIELLMPETMKLLGSTKNEITKDENGENVPHLGLNDGNNIISANPFVLLAARFVYYSACIIKPFYYL